MYTETLAVVVLAGAFFLYRIAYGTDKPKIKGLPEVPGLPVFGSLIDLGIFHSKAAAKMSEKHGPVFQARLGNRRIVFANTFDSVRHLWVTNQSALISRPTLHTFHSVVSTSQGFTIGTSPWDDSCKRRRKAAATALNKPATQSYMPIIDLESTVSIRELREDSEGGNVDVDPVAYFQRYALNTSLTLNYGFRIKGNVNDELLHEITHVERMVSNFRSTSNNWQDYIPLMRIWPSRNRSAQESRARRDVYMGKLLGRLKEEIAEGRDRPCITGNILKDPEAKLNDAEIDSIGLTMVSAGLDTVPGNLIMTVAFLASAEGQDVQKKAYAEIMQIYPNGEGWEQCLVEEKVSYITALVKEALRYWTVIPICLPRTSIKDVEWQGAVIPAGTTFYMNAWAADYDKTHFKDPMRFWPERYISDKSESSGTPHYGYGAGSRMCAGSHLANRELYTAFLRLIMAFEITECEGQGDRPVLDALLCNATPTSLTMDPRHFKANFKERNPAMLSKWIEESEARTAHL